MTTPDPTKALSTALATAAAVPFLLMAGACERHDWDEVQVLYQPHHGGAHGEGDAHHGDGHGGEHEAGHGSEGEDSHSPGAAGAAGEGAAHP